MIALLLLIDIVTLCFLWTTTSAFHCNALPIQRTTTTTTAQLNGKTASRDSKTSLVFASVDNNDDAKVDSFAMLQQDPSSMTIVGSSQPRGTKKTTPSQTLEECWDVYVCQSKPCKERGASATLDAFVGLSPPNRVTVHPAILSNSKRKGPNVRIVPRHGHDNGQQKSLEVTNVDSVDKVYLILTKYLNMEVDPAARECLKWNYRGNAHLEKGEITKAIEAYNKAIATDYKEQEGVVLLMRATAYLRRAFAHQKELRLCVADLTLSVPDPAVLGRLYSLVMEHPTLANPIFQRVTSDCKVQDKKFRQTKFRHGLYEFALLNAARDSLRATQLLPNYAKAWLRAGDSLTELRKLKESAQYYEKAMELDSSLQSTLLPAIKSLKKSQEFLEKARENGWSEDTLRLALDVAG